MTRPVAGTAPHALPPGAAPKPLLEVRRLRTEFGTPLGVAQVVNDVSFTVNRGEILGIVGESGCGKSVTIRSILGLVRQPGRVAAGEAVFDGRDLLAMKTSELRDIRGKDIGFIAQNPFSSLNPVLRISKQLHNVLRSHDRQRAANSYEIGRAALASVGIAGPERVLDGYAHQLSGGTAQRVIIAMSMLLDPALVIADEPTTGLDLTVQRQILDLVRGLVREHERSMMLVTHDLGVVAHYCDRVVVMYAGRIVEQGAVQEVLRAPKHPYTRALLDAIPRQGRPLVHLKGRLPDLVNYPSGCPFAPRCSHAFEPCTTGWPDATSSPDGHTYWCHLGAEDKEVGNVPA
jgi:oligopeptide/dipeptide ABC transporter ATP-binding protein